MFSGLSPLVLVWHAPPANTALDKTADGIHVGSRAIREFIDKHQPKYFFCGHIHEAAGVEVQIGKTKARNVGRMGFLLNLP